MLRAPVCVLVCLCACGPTEETDLSVQTQRSGLVDDNGLNSNALNSNALRGNSLSTNALRGNALRGNALRGNGLNGVAANVTLVPTTNALFAAWFQTDAYNPTIMRYFVSCALPAGQSLTYGSYTWNGFFGAAPNWFSGVEQTTAEEESMTACLMAHVNALAQPVTLSFRTDLVGNAPSAELGATPDREGAFFGNLWAPTPVLYACAAPAYSKVVSCTITDNGATITRSCATTTSLAGNATSGRSCATGTNCGFTNLGACQGVCSGTSTVDGRYTGCSVAGHAYATPFSTFVQPYCGDLTCQASVTLPNGSVYSENATSCPADCTPRTTKMVCGTYKICP